MPTYKLNLDLNKEQLKAIHDTNSNIILAKPTGGVTSPNVAWQSFRPLESNSVTWEEQYGIYASTVSVENGAELDQMSWTDAVAAKQYTLEPHGAFSDPNEWMEGKEDSYYATNKYPESTEKPEKSEKPYMTIGLYQDAIVNGEEVKGNALSATHVMRGSTAKMTPYTTVYAWVQSEVESSTVVTHITSTHTKALFGGDATEITLGFDSLKGCFLPKANS